MKNSAVNGATERHTDVGNAVKAIGGSSSALSREFQNFVSDIEDLIQSGTSLSGNELKKVKEQIQERIGTAKDALESATHSVVERGRAAAAATNEYVTEQPWKAIGIGTSLGFLIGLLVSRR